MDPIKFWAADGFDIGAGGMVIGACVGGTMLVDIDGPKFNDGMDVDDVLVDAKVEGVGGTDGFLLLLEGTMGGTRIPRLLVTDSVSEGSTFSL